MKSRPRNPILVLITALLVLAGALPAVAGGFTSISFRSGYGEVLVRSAESKALADADQAVAAGPFAALVNAAPLTGGDGAEASYMKFDYFADLFEFTVGGAQATWAAWRVSAINAEEHYRIRTAYNPEGFDNKNSFLLLNASWEASRYFFPDSNWRWAVGAGYRHHEFLQLDDSVDGWDLDLGSTANWRRDLAQGRLEFSGSFLLRNVTDRKITIGTRQGSLPRYRNFGLAVTYVADTDAVPLQEIRLRGMITLRKDQIADEGGFLGDALYGGEIQLLETLALRVGYDGERFLEDELSWGLGVTLPARLAGPFVARYDFADLDDSGTSLIPDLGERNLHTFTLGYRF